MFEIASETRTRCAYRRAHEARGTALRDALAWLFRR